MGSAEVDAQDPLSVQYMPQPHNGHACCQTNVCISFLLLHLPVVMTAFSTKLINPRQEKYRILKFLNIDIFEEYEIFLIITEIHGTFITGDSVAY